MIQILTKTLENTGKLKYNSLKTESERQEFMDLFPKKYIRYISLSKPQRVDVVLPPILLKTPSPSAKSSNISKTSTELLNLTELSPSRLFKTPSPSDKLSKTSTEPLAFASLETPSPSYELTQPLQESHDSQDSHLIQSQESMEGDQINQSSNSISLETSSTITTVPSSTKSSTSRLQEPCPNQLTQPVQESQESHLIQEAMLDDESLETTVQESQESLLTQESMLDESLETTSTGTSLSTSSESPYRSLKTPITRSQGTQLIHTQESMGDDEKKLVDIYEIVDEDMEISINYIRKETIQADKDETYFLIDFPKKINIQLEKLEQRFPSSPIKFSNKRDSVVAVSNIDFGEHIEVFGNIVHKDRKDYDVISVGDKNFGLLIHDDSLSSGKIEDSCSPNVILRSYNLNGCIYLTYETLASIKAGNCIHARSKILNPRKYSKQICQLSHKNCRIFVQVRDQLDLELWVSKLIVPPPQLNKVNLDEVMEIIENKFSFKKDELLISNLYDHAIVSEILNVIIFN